MTNCCNPRGTILIDLKCKCLSRNALIKIRVVRDPAFWAEPALPSHPPPGDSLQTPVFLWLAYLSRILCGWLLSCRHRLGSGGRSLSRSVGAWAGSREVEAGRISSALAPPRAPSAVRERSVDFSSLGRFLFSSSKRYPDGRLRPDRIFKDFVPAGNYRGKALPERINSIVELPVRSGTVPFNPRICRG